MVGARRVLMLRLHGSWLGMVLLGCAHFTRRRPSARAGGTAIEADSGGVVDYDGLVVDVGDACFADVHDGAVVEEAATAPFPAFESDAAVPEPVIHAAIEADVPSPIAAMKEIDAIRPTPVPRSPEQTHGGRLDPSARHPVIAVRPPLPKPGRPHIALRRQGRLYIDGQRGRLERDRYSDPDLCL